MICIKDKRFCVGCANCVQTCPIGCIKFKRDTEGFMYPITDNEKCIQCGKCNHVCPVEQDTIKSHIPYETRAFGAINRDLATRMQSSSGGLFSVFASYILNKGGKVCGASISEGKVRHIIISNLEELHRLQCSKYVQSDITGIFLKIKHELRNGTPILFSGTPCQVKALYTYLGKRPHNILTLEVICHGVPSHMIFERYLQETGASSMVFRKKDRSWSDYDIELLFNNQKTKTEKARNNLYMRGFLQNWFLRPSCSRCPAKSFSSGADITLGDFWGGEKLAPDLFDDKGTSIVFIHTQSAEKVWNDISDQIEAFEVLVEDAIKKNTCISHSVTFPTNRNNFFYDIENQPLLKSLKIYTRKKYSILKVLKIGLLKIWNRLWDLGIILKELFFRIVDKYYCFFHSAPDIKNIEESIIYILNHHCSVSRFGDGELKFINGSHTWFQNGHPLLQSRLREILQNNQENLIVCVPNVFGTLSLYTEHDKKYWQQHITHTRKIWYRYLDKNKTYYDAFISRCYMPYRDKSRAKVYFKLWKKIWDNRELLILEGEKTRLGVDNDLFDNVKSIKRILCPNTQAFSYYDQLFNEALKYDKNKLVLIALGPTATVLAADLCSKGYQAIDIGHIDIEYEWFMMQATHKIPVKNKFVNEAGAGRGVGDIENEKYISEIVCQF